MFILFSMFLLAYRQAGVVQTLKCSIQGTLQGYCHIQLTIATPYTTISPLIKTAVKFTILSGNFAAWVR